MANLRAIIARSLGLLVALSVQLNHAQSIARGVESAGRWQTLYITPEGGDGEQGNGSQARPFWLHDGNEYEFNQLLRPWLDGGVNLDVVFLDGNYADVRLQIIKQGIDSTQISLQDPAGEPVVQGGRTLYKRLVYRKGCRCNRDGENCRVPPEYFTEGPTCRATLVLRAANPGRAVFTGRKYKRVHKNLDSEALLIGGAWFGAAREFPEGLKSQRISRVVVSGLTFAGYPNGIHVQYASDIVIERCRIADMGNECLSNPKTEPMATSAVGINSNSQVVLFKNNVVADTWNSISPELARSKDDGDRSIVGAIHPLYLGSAKDLIFLNNRFENSSGPFLKLGYYPVMKGERIVNEWPTAIADRRNFFIGNTFVQNKTFDVTKEKPIFFPIMSFIHENSVRDDETGKMSAPAKGQIFLNNDFRMAQRPNLVSCMSFLRLEVMPRYRPTFPGWYFAGNSIWQMAPDRIVVQRQRGSDISVRSMQDIFRECEPILHLSPQLSEDAPKLTARQTDEVIADLMRTTLRSSDPRRDQYVGEIISRGSIPGFDLPEASKAEHQTSP